MIRSERCLAYGTLVAQYFLFFSVEDNWCADFKMSHGNIRIYSNLLEFTRIYIESCKSSQIQYPHLIRQAYAKTIN